MIYRSKEELLSAYAMEMIAIRDLSDIVGTTERLMNTVMNCMRNFLEMNGTNVGENLLQCDIEDPLSFFSFILEMYEYTQWKLHNCAVLSCILRVVGQNESMRRFTVKHKKLCDTLVKKCEKPFQGEEDLPEYPRTVLSTIRADTKKALLPVEVQPVGEVAVL